MGNPNVRPSDDAVLAAVINPSSQAVGSVDSAWVSMADFEAIQAPVLVGAFGAAATVDALLQQATDAAGTGAKAITGKAITQLLAAGGNNRQAIINCRSEELDVENAFTHVRLRITVGAAATLTAGAVLGHYARYQPEDDATSVAEVVG